MTEDDNRPHKAAEFAAERAFEDSKGRAAFVGTIMLVVGIVVRMTGHTDFLLIGGLALLAGCVTWTMFRWIWAIFSFYGRRGMIVMIMATFALIGLTIFSSQTDAFLDALDYVKGWPAAQYRGHFDTYVQNNQWSPYCVVLDESAWDRVKKSKFAPEYILWYSEIFPEGRHQAELTKLREAGRAGDR